MTAAVVENELKLRSAFGFSLPWQRSAVRREKRPDGFVKTAIEFLVGRIRRRSHYWRRRKTDN